MSAVAECRTALVQAFNAIGEPGVTATRAFKAAEQALTDFDAQMALLRWERERVERVTQARAEREQQARDSRAAFEAEVARVERKKARR